MHVRITVTTQLLNTTQHRTVPIIFPLIFQTIVIAKMMSTGKKRQQKIFQKVGSQRHVNHCLNLKKFHAIQKQNGLQ